ncbi:hypothetical protein Glove_33g181 [Diversispora epigaea]|uniref:BTB domain-containing protein n=1 Tax=Diversispora epigaea TaxID=1348612 RepID=A0A397JHV7_9GLOM|nr:hypothetical protein Glove_33g181 [Diversispora epigaea]
MSLKFFDKLSQNFIELLNDKDDFNVIFEVENKEKSFTAHSNVLKYRSSYFRKELENIQPNEKNIKIITKPSISSKIFDVILKYVYGGIVNLEKAETGFIFDLMLMANEFELLELSRKIEIILIEDKASWLKTHFSFVYRSIFVKENFKDLENFFENKEKSFTAHSNVLKYRSSYFRKELENIQPNEKNIKIITKPSISSKIFDVILKYVYGGIVNLEKAETGFIFDLMLMANEFELLELSRKIEIILIEDKASWLKTHFSFVYRSIFVKENFKDLENFCNNIIVKYPNLIFDSSDFTFLPESALVSLLKRDDLQMKEVEIWDYVIKWGITQNPTLPKNLGDWTEENFLTLKTTLQQCLPHIRYFHIIHIEIYDKIRPYKKILDKQLWEDIKQHLAAPDRTIKSIILPARSVLNTELPPRTTGPFSTIISEDHAAEISSWIDRKTDTYSTTNIPYKFESILCGTRDGFAPQTFWNICHGHACTIVVAKVKGTDEILGGYNPLAWDNTLDGNSNIWIETNDSFAFSLKNGNIQNSIISRVKDTRYAILKVSKNNQKEYGPYFGVVVSLYSKKSDFNLDCLSFCDHIFGHFYEKRVKTSSDRFSIDNYEVFKVIKKS